MKFTETALSGCYVIDLERIGDDRGFFARGWCSKEFEAIGLSPRICQANVSYNNARGTLRGLHYQLAPHGEAKLVRCTQGAVFDVAVDLRAESPTFRQWFGLELSSENRRMLYIPESFGHGFLTLEDDTEAYYLVSEFYTPEAERGARYDDPAFGIEWPTEITAISEKDANWPRFEV
jgi:dTDP-4-dehydrorhamnose 3,5-epimerase